MVNSLVTFTYQMQETESAEPIDMVMMIDVSALMALRLCQGDIDLRFNHSEEMIVTHSSREAGRVFEIIRQAWVAWETRFQESAE